ncbi:hypothetical protein Fcan01_12281 [Folsomia candida]|uniref:Uncharacterized protein n=1 Tax=Folsomia candida TaxID=158441 RepID=A0A226E8Q6_FOLCA|nr:hypothetical protein Fcan01_12281 [Folsomia candida]
MIVTMTLILILIKCQKHVRSFCAKKKLFVLLLIVSTLIIIYFFVDTRILAKTLRTYFPRQNNNVTGWINSTSIFPILENVINVRAGSNVTIHLGNATWKPLFTGNNGTSFLPTGFSNISSAP